MRFDDVLTRMHALTKASTLGLLLVLIGAAFHLDDPNDITSLALAAGLQLLTSPVSAHLIGRATYRAEGIDHRLDMVDELAASGVEGAERTSDRASAPIVTDWKLPRRHGRLSCRSPRSDHRPSRNGY